jgi:flagella basal body P-ring formation protein FlgA
MYNLKTIGYIAILWGTMFVSVQAAEIRLKNTPIRCTESLVTLADIADVLPMKNENVEALRKMELFPTPTDGEKRTLDQWQLRTMLSQLGVNSLLHSVTGAEKITVQGAGGIRPPINPVNPNEQFVVVQAHYTTPSDTNSAVPIPVRSDVSPKVAGITDEMAKLLEKQISQALNVYLNFTNRIERSWDISFKLTPEQIKLFASNGQIVEITGGQIPFTGVQQFQIRMQTNVTITVDAAVTLPMEVVVVRRTLPKGYIISESDVMMRQVDSVKSRSGQGEEFFVDVKSVIGKEIAKPVRELMTLTQSDIRQPLWVRKGEIVTVYARNGGATVQTEATALQDGVEGDTIMVAKIDSSPAKKGKKEEPITYLARVCRPKTVEVFVN